MPTRVFFSPFVTFNTSCLISKIKLRENSSTKVTIFYSKLNRIESKTLVHIIIIANTIFKKRIFDQIYSNLGITC